MSRQFSRCLTPVLKSDAVFLNLCRQLCQQQAAPKENPFLEKYADKIAALQNSSPEECQRRLEQLKKPSANRGEATSDSRTSPISQSEGKTFPSYQNNKGLDAVMKLDLLRDKSAQEIESIWKKYHKEKDGLYAILPAAAYKKIIGKLNEFPTFLFPLPRAQGYEFVMSQFSGNSCHFTSLVNYQAYKENAPVCLNISYFAELVEEKGIALMRGEYDSNALKAHEAQCLTNQMQLYYGDGNEKREGLLWRFNKQPESFKHMDLISELEFGLQK